MGTEKLVDCGQLAANAGGFPSRRLDGPLGAAQLVANGVDRRIGGFASRAAGFESPRPRFQFRGGKHSTRLELREISLELRAAVLLERRQRRLERGHAGDGLEVRRVSPRLGCERPKRLASSRQTGLGGEDPGAHRLGPVCDPLARATGGEATTRELLSLSAALRERLLGRFAASCDAQELALDLHPLTAGAGRARLRLRHPVALRADVVSRQLPSRLQRLTLEPGVELGGLSLALEGTKP